MDWNGNGREDMGDWYIDYEIMNRMHDEEEEERCTSSSTYHTSTARTKKQKAPLTEEELERNGRDLRHFFIMLGLVVAIIGLQNNIGWLFYNPQYVSWFGIILSITILVIIIRNIRKHNKEKRRKKKDGGSL